jgi:hypothetical protein
LSVRDGIDRILLGSWVIISDQTLKPSKLGGMLATGPKAVKSSFPTKFEDFSPIEHGVLRDWALLAGVVAGIAFTSILAHLPSVGQKRGGKRNVFAKSFGEHSE